MCLYVFSFVQENNINDEWNKRQVLHTKWCWFNNQNTLRGVLNFLEVLSLYTYNMYVYMYKCAQSSELFVYVIKEKLMLENTKKQRMKKKEKRKTKKNMMMKKKGIERKLTRHCLLLSVLCYSLSFFLCSVFYTVSKNVNYDSLMISNMLFY